MMKKIFPVKNVKFGYISWTKYFYMLKLWNTSLKLSLGWFHSYRSTSHNVVGRRESFRTGSWQVFLKIFVYDKSTGHFNKKKFEQFFMIFFNFNFPKHFSLFTNSNIVLNWKLNKYAYQVGFLGHSCPSLLKHFFYKSRTVIVWFTFSLQMLNHYLCRISDFISILFQDVLQENIWTKYCKSTGQTFGHQLIWNAVIFKRSSQKHCMLEHWRIILMQQIRWSWTEFQLKN